MRGDVVISRVRNGKIDEVRRVRNLVVNGGLSRTVDNIFSNGPAFDNGSTFVVSYGSSSTSPTATDTILGSAYAYVWGYWEAGTTGVYKVTGFFPVTATQTAREAGIHAWTPTSAPLPMLARVTFSDIGLVNTDALIVQWTITYTDGG